MNVMLRSVWHEMWFDDRVDCDLCCMYVNHVNLIFLPVIFHHAYTFLVNTMHILTFTSLWLFQLYTIILWFLIRYWQQNFFFFLEKKLTTKLQGLHHYKVEVYVENDEFLPILIITPIYMIFFFFENYANIYVKVKV